MKSKWKVESEKIDRGVPFEVYRFENGDVAVINLSYMSAASNAKFEKEAARLAKPHRKAIQRETIDPEVAKAMQMKAFVRTIVKGWTNCRLTEDPKDNMVFNEQNATELFAELPELYEACLEFASDRANFQDCEACDDEANEEAAKNSPSSSSTNSSFPTPTTPQSPPSSDNSGEQGSPTIEPSQAQN